MSKHTPEISEALAVMFGEYDRVRACVNACRDIPNPAAIPGVVEILRELLRQEHERRLEQEQVTDCGTCLEICYELWDSARSALAALDGEG